MRYVFGIPYPINIIIVIILIMQINFDLYLKPQSGHIAHLYSLLAEVLIPAKQTNLSPGSNARTEHSTGVIDLSTIYWRVKHLIALRSFPLICLFRTKQLVICRAFKNR